MLAALAVVIGCATVLLVEGSIVYYRHPSAPDWLRSRPSLQTTLSTLFSTGIMLAIVLAAQFLAHGESRTLNLGEIAVIVASVSVGFWLWRKIRRIGRELDAARGNVIPMAIDLAGAEPEVTPRPVRPVTRTTGKTARKKAA